MSKKENRFAESPQEPARMEPVVEAAATVPGTGSASGSDTPVNSESPSLTPEKIEEWKAKAAKADEFWDRLLRLTADLENFKKRAARERQDAVKYANESLLEKLIPVLDNFDMAVAAANNNQQNGSVDSIRTGITMIGSQLKAVMADAGLEEIDAANKTFDANWHEAVSQQETADTPEGQVLQQLRKGYKLRDRLLRPATVVVAKKPAA